MRCCRGHGAGGSGTFSRKPNRSATASRSLSAKTLSYISLVCAAHDVLVSVPCDTSSGRLTAAAEETITEVGEAHGWRRRRPCRAAGAAVFSYFVVAQRRMLATGDEER